MLASIFIVIFDFTNLGAPGGDRTRDLAIMSRER
jgi:hypothetical protein